MNLSVGDKVRVYFYPPKSTRSFVEGIVDRSEINTFRGLSFSLQATREVVLGHDVSPPRTLPYIIAYVKEDDFDGRIQVLEPAAPDAFEPGEMAEEQGLPTETQVEVKIEPETQNRGWRRLFNRAA